MMVRVRILIAAAMLSAAGGAPAQTPSLVMKLQRGASDASLLDRPARLFVRDVTLATALTRLSQTSAVPVAFSPSLVAGETRLVDCDCRNVTVRDALERLLEGTSFGYREMRGEVLVFRDVPAAERPSARFAMQPLEPALARSVRRAMTTPAAGTITGRVTNAETGEPVVNAQVSVDGAGRAFTDREGRYRIPGVATGRHTIGATSIGYSESTKEVVVGDGTTVTVDFALEVSPSKLDALVVTATGEQRLRELGHVVGRINADSLIKEAPISTISELLTGRVPGVQVFQTSGIVGGDVQLQVRTPNSLLLGTQPIVIVDGVRYTNTAARDPARDGSLSSTHPSFYGRHISTGPAQGHEVTSPLNDINPNDIASIEVVKGPTAVTLYGTDAANGVILITTKRGRTGPPRWNAYVRGSLTEAPENASLQQYFAWGSTPTGELFGFTSGGVFHPSNCRLEYVAAGFCVQDSIAAFNPLADPDLTIFESAPQWTYGLNVSGGTENVRYYVSGSFQREIGPIRMPRAFVDSIEAARGAPLPEEQLRPNALTNMNLHSNLSVAFGRVRLQGNLGYVHRRNRTLDHSVYNIGNGEPGSPWGGGGDPYGTNSPADRFSSTSIDEVDRFIAGARANWQPLSWLEARAGAGIDLSLGRKHSLLRRGQVQTYLGDRGQVQEDFTQQRGTSADIGLTARFARGRVSSRTSIGAQYNRSLNEITIAQGTGLVPGGESVTQADERFADRIYSETVTLGTYAEQMFGLNDRLFATAALRVDGASNFGEKYQAAVYPRVGASWIVSEEPFLPRLPALDELRLRYAFGTSGQQAYAWMKLPTFDTPLGAVDGTTAAVIDVSALGNEHLRPERVSEHEFGFDVAMLRRRVNLSATWYRREVVDQIMRLELPPGLGSIYTNLGLSTTRGFEARLGARVLDSRWLSWDISLNHASFSTLVVDLGDADDAAGYLGGFKEGYSLGARFYRQYLGFEDTNGDGIIVPSELQWSDSAVYVGESLPRHTQALHTTFGFYDRRLRVSASFNRSAGHMRVPYPHPCAGSKCLPLLDPNTPVEEQAAALASARRIQSANLPADETRLSALTVTAELPSGILERVGARSGTLSVSARNLARWNDYPGDPGSVQVRGISTGLAAGIPQARSWTFRFDLGF